MPNVAETLAEREKNYGNFWDNAKTTQALKEIMRDTPEWENLPSDMRESLELIATKIGRVLHGNPEHHDSWHDIAGYAKLVADRLEASK